MNDTFAAIKQYNIYIYNIYIHICYICIYIYIHIYIYICIYIYIYNIKAFTIYHIWGLKVENQSEKKIFFFIHLPAIQNLLNHYIPN